MHTERVSVTLKLTPGKDDDLLDWWASIPVGKRQPVIKALLRAALAQAQPEQPEHKIEDIARDTAWLREALTKLPDHLEALLSQVDLQPRAAKHPIEGVQLSNSETSRREKRISKASW